MADRYDPPTGDHAGMVKDECGLFMFVADHDTETAAHLATIERLRGLLKDVLNNAEQIEPGVYDRIEAELKEGE